MTATLVTGATGFVGSHVARLLAARGDRIRVLVRRTSRLDAIAGLPCDVVYGDLLDRPSLDAAVQGVRHVFHAAADYRLWSRDPAVIYETNVTGTTNLCRACMAHGIDRFVYTSSVATIQPSLPGRPLPDETNRVGLDTVVGHYKRSKRLAEDAVLDAIREGLPAVIVNPTTPVGPGDWKPTPTGKIIVDFLRGRVPAYVDTGLNLVPVEDVAEGHLLAADRGRIGERYLLGGDNMSLHAILQTLADITGRAAPSLRIPHAVAIGVAHISELIARIGGGEPAVPVEAARMSRVPMFVDAGKARQELGFTPGSVRDALERAVRWYIEHGYASPITGRRNRDAPAGSQV